MRRIAFAGAAVLGLVLCVAAIPSARADMQVLESNSSAYPVGRRLPDGAQLKLRAGEQVKVLLLPANRTKVFKGPPVSGSGQTGGAGGTRGVVRPKPAE
jgi:hypothetical protein